MTGTFFLLSLAFEGFHLLRSTYRVGSVRMGTVVTLKAPGSIRSTAVSGCMVSEKLPKTDVPKLKKGKKYFSKTMPEKIIS